MTERLEVGSRVERGDGRITIYVGACSRDLAIDEAEHLADMIRHAWDQAAVDEDDVRAEMAEYVAEHELVEDLDALLHGRRLRPEALSALRGADLGRQVGGRWELAVSADAARDILDRARGL